MTEKKPKILALSITTLSEFIETCCKVICRDCTISEEHNRHNFQIISECYPKHFQVIENHLDLLRLKNANIDTAIAAGIVSREREVVQQGEDIKNEVHMHAQKLIDQIQRSERQLLQEVDTVVQHKRELLTSLRQREQAERVQTRLKTCQEMVETSLKE